MTADEVYGGSPALCGWLESRQLPYVLAVGCTEPLRSPSGTPASAARLADPEGFAGMGCVEALVHGHDIAQGLGLALDPPREVCTRVLARMFPHAVADLADLDPWTALLWATGHIALPGRPRVAHWRWHGAPLNENG